jgi:hypothetical protein
MAQHTIDLPCNADIEINEQSPDTNYGTSQTLIGGVLQTGSSLVFALILLKFNFTSLPIRKKVTSAKVRVYNVNTLTFNNDENALNIKHNYNYSWSESDTWNSINAALRSASGGLFFQDQTIPGSQYIEIEQANTYNSNKTSFENSGVGLFWHQAYDNVYQTGYITIQSREGANPPMLRVIYEDVPPDKPVLKSPIGTFEDSSSIIRFDWDYVSSVGGTQAKFDFQWSTDNSTWSAAVTQTTANTYYDMPADTLPAGNVYWRVQTYNEYDEASGYSDSQAFYSIAAPATPGVTVESASRPIINWTAESGQQVYQIQIFNGVTIVYDSSPLPGIVIRTHVVTNFLQDGTYTAKVRVKNQYDLWSAWGETQFIITTTKPSKPNISIETITNGLKIETVGDDDYILYRSEANKNDFISIFKAENSVGYGGKVEFEATEVNVDVLADTTVKVDKTGITSTGISNSDDGIVIYEYENSLTTLPEVTYSAQGMPSPVTTVASVISLPSTVVTSELSLVAKGKTRTNLIPYSNMDTDSNADGVVDGFLGINSAGTSGTYTVDGGQKIALTGANSDGIIACVQTMLNFKAGDVVSFSVEYKIAQTAGTTFRAEVVVWAQDAVGASVDYRATVIPPTSSTWATIKLENFILPANTSRVMIELRARTGTDITSRGSAWFKNAMIEKASAVGNYISSGVKSIGNLRVKAIGKNTVKNGNGEEGLDGWVSGNIGTNGTENPADSVVIDTDGSFKVVTTAVWRGLYSKKFIPINSSSNYYLKCRCKNTGVAQISVCVEYYASDKVWISGQSFGNTPYTVYTDIGMSLTIPAGACYVKVYVYMNVADTLNIKQIQLEQGTAPSTYEPYTETITYLNPIQGTMKSLPSGDADSIDINTGANIQRISDWVTLDGSKSWVFEAEYLGTKAVRVTIDSNVVTKTEYIIKYNDTALTHTDGAINSADKSSMYTNIVYINVSDVDSGWWESTSPTVGEMQAYFYGWKMCNPDGTSPYFVNETIYNPTTWAEWVKDAGVVGDSTGLEWTLSGSSQNGFLTTNLKTNTKYGVLYNVVSNGLVSNALSLGNELTGTYPSLVNPGDIGNKKITITTAATITTNKMRITKGNLLDVGLKVKLKDIRVIELPAGSQIESDFTNITADQLAAKYTYKSSNTKYWKKITDGTGATSTLPTATYLGYTPYKMIYQLATPVVSTIEGMGQLVAEPNGSIIVESVSKERKAYNNGITTDYLIKTLLEAYRVWPTVKTTFFDYAVANGKAYEYFVRAFTADEAYEDSDTISGQASFKYSLVAPVPNLSDIFTFNLSLNTPPKKSYQRSTNIQYVYYAGRTYAVSETSEHLSAALALLFFLKTYSEVERFIELYDMKETVLYRDNRGRKIFGKLDNLSVNDERSGFTVGFTLAQVDYIEELEV